MREFATATDLCYARRAKPRNLKTWIASTRTIRPPCEQMRRSYLGTDQEPEAPLAETKQASDRRGLYYEALEVKTLGFKPHPELYQRLADLREKMGRYDEARAWHRLVLRDQPDDPLSLAALGRLK